MDLNNGDLQDLAEFFGRRLDPTLQHAPPAADTRTANQRTAAWRLVLEEAAEANRLSGLFMRIQRKHPHDEQLQHALALLLEPSRRNDTLIGLFLLASTAAGFLLMGTGITGGALVWYASTQQPIVAHASLGQATIATLQTGQNQAPQRSEKAAPSGRCTVPDGGRVGYWYAGSEAPGAPGDEVHLSGSVNVRTDYPDAHNHYNTGAHIRCVLQSGDRVVLSKPPIHVPGGSWWVPLLSGDLQHP